MQDEELVDLCKQIYRKHREAIDLVVQHGAASKVLDICQETVKSQVNPDYIHVARKRVWFVTKEMANAQKPVLTGWPFLPARYPIAWWFFYGKKRGKIQLTLEVGPVDNSELRIKLLTFINNSGFNIRDKGFRKEAKFTRIYTITKTLRTDDDGEVDDGDEYIKELTKSMWNKAYSETSHVVDI